MTNNGDDCYFFFYSNCFKGDSCPFRHCEAALGNETVCSLWQEGRCFRTVCKFRHMEIPKNRKEIACYWEKQPTGCQKPHCAFFHEKPRYVEGIFVPPDKSQSRNEEQKQQQQLLQEQQEEPAAPPAAPLPTVVANPQLRGVIKTEAQELVPSPTHPPVVINPADDDEDEDDQISEEGEDARGGPSPRKHPKLDDSLNFGVSTLEEIRLRKALKASMKRAGYPIQSTQPPANGEKENIQDYFHAPLLEPHYGGSVLERLGRKVPYRDANGVEGLPLKRSLAQRLGRVVDSEPPQKSFKPVRDRLGLFPGVAPSPQPPQTCVAVENAEVSTKAPEQIRIKTLDEIRREKAAQNQNQSDITSPAEMMETIPVKGPKGIKRSITVKGTTVSHNKSLSESIHTTKKRQGDELSSSSKKAKYEGKRSRESEEAERPVAEVKVKTLEEIRKEKAARSQTTEAENKKSPQRENDSPKRPPLPRLRRAPAALAENVPVEKEAAATQKPSKPGAGRNETRNVKVKSFEEIMREKRLRRQEQQEQQEEEQARSSAGEETSQSKLPAAAAAAATGLLKKKLPEPVQPSARVPSYKKVSFKHQDANAAVAVDQTEQNSSSPTRTSFESESKQTKCSSSPSPVKELNAASPAGEETTESTRSRPMRRSNATKVRPKLKVKPSVKPAQKKRGAVASAVAAVKPLRSRSASTGREQSKQEAAPTRMEAVSSLNGDVEQSSAPSSRLVGSGSGSDSSSAALGRERETAPLGSKPVFSLHKNPAPKTPPQPQSSPAPKASPQPPSRRSSGATRTTSVCSAGSSSAAPVDDFDDLINEFTDDHLEGDMDPSIGEDDLMQELTDMIGS